MKRHKKSLELETLERRNLLASVWQANPNRYDVDSTGTVVPVDALLIINDLNQNGNRQLPVSVPNGYSGAYCDVNGDGLMSPTDALQVINVLDQVSPNPTIDVNLSGESDLNGDQTVLKSNVVYDLVASANDKVVVEKLNDAKQVVSTASFTVGNDGKLAINQSLDAGENHIRFTVTNVRGFSKSTERLTRLGDAVTAWNTAMLYTVRETTNVLSTGVLVKPPPPMVAKYMAMVHGAMFDAVNAIKQTYQGYAYTAIASSSASDVAAAATAAYYVAREVYPTDHEKIFWDKTLDEVLATVPDGAPKTVGKIVGQQAATFMISKRANDGSSATSTYQTTDQPGHWQKTPPDFLSPTLPQWGDVTPFGLTSGSQFRPAAPPALNSAEYAAAVDQVMRLGASSSSERTADQTAIAKFWADGGGTATPPGHWNIIASDVSASRNLSLLESARTFALMNFAMADAGITAWDAKYEYDLWRPIDAIRKADTDGNAATVQDVNWSPLLVTPSFPSYTSGHSTFSGAAAAVLSSLFGSNVSFTAWADPGSTGQWPPSSDVSTLATRTFTGFTQAAEEAGMSRIYGGIHYSFDNTAGLSSGNSVGNWTIQNLLKPK
ncbi:MAG: phosphatase PAP2 family protein [Pirellulales bacterium]